MQDLKQNVELWGKLAASQWGFGSHYRGFHRGGSWDIQTIVYAGAGAALVVGTLAYYLTHRYLSKRCRQR